jgi:hypothetical protein
MRLLPAGGVAVAALAMVAWLSCGDDQGPRSERRSFEGIREFDWNCNPIGGDTTDFMPRPLGDIDTTVAPPIVGPPLNYSLIAACPNPTQGSTTLRFQIPQADSVWLFVYDFTNSPPIETVYARRGPTGVYAIRWLNLNAPGVFRVEMNAGNGFRSHGDVQFDE